MSRSEVNGWTGERIEEVLAVTGLVAERFHVMQPPAEWNSGRAGGGDLDCWIRGLDPQWPLRLPPGWRLVQALQDRFSRWQWWLETPHGNEVIDTTEDPDGLETGIGPRALDPSQDVEAPPAARAIYLTQKRLYKGMLDDARWNEIASLAAHDPSMYRRVLQTVFGKRVGERIARVGLEGVPPDADLVAAHRRAHKLQWVRLPRYAVNYGVGEVKRLVRRLLLPTGLNILVVGPDGSGKSTFAEALLSGTETLFRRRVHVHWRPGGLPPISRLLRRSGSDVTRPHSQTRHSRPMSYLALAYYWFDNVWGGWGKLRHARRRTGLVLVERGWWDIAVDPRRYRLRVGPRAVKVLGLVLPKPDLIFILDGPPELFAARKGELTPEEIDRQLDIWRDLAPTLATTVSVDAARSVEGSVAEARERVVDKLERRTLSRIGTGWMALPPLNEPRFVLPRGPAAAAAAGLSIYQPMTLKGRIAWEVARVGARAGVFRLSHRGQPPPHDVREILSKHVPRGGTIALQRTNHSDRWVALVVDARGRAHRLIKLSTSIAGCAALEREAHNLDSFASRLVRPLIAPRLIGSESNAIVFEPVRWSPRRRPWQLPADVAFAAGCLTRATEEGEPFAHGDFAPWNLLKTREGWVLIDWETAGMDYPLMFDLFHFIVQSHALLGRPTWHEIEAALDRHEGILGESMKSFVAGAGADQGSLSDAFIEYLHTSKAMFDPGSPTHRIAIEARDRLIAAR